MDGIAIDKIEIEQRARRGRGQPRGTFHLDRHADTLIQAAHAAREPDALLTAQELSRWLRVSIGWLEVQRRRGNGPPFRKLAPNQIRYQVAEVNAWLDTRRRMSTSEYSKRPRKATAPSAPPQAEPIANTPARPRIILTRPTK
jgi:hypothetical protein